MNKKRLVSGRKSVSIYDYEGDTVLEVKDKINKSIQRFNLKSESELVDVRNAIDKYLSGADND